MSRRGIASLDDASDQLPVSDNVLKHLARIERVSASLWDMPY